MYSIFKLALGLCLVGICYNDLKGRCTKSPYYQDMALLHEHKIPDNDNSKCLLACVYKKANWLDGKGMLDVANVNSMMEKEHVSDPQKLESTKKLLEICKKVNDEAVTDGEKGCQRSAILTTCLTENAPKVGLPLVM